MKYDDMEILNSYNYEQDNVTMGKLHKKRRVNPLDIAVVSSICAVLISGTVLVSKLMSSGFIETIMNSIK